MSPTTSRTNRRRFTGSAILRSGRRATDSMLQVLEDSTLGNLVSRSQNINGNEVPSNHVCLAWIVFELKSKTRFGSVEVLRCSCKHVLLSKGNAPWITIRLVWCAGRCTARAGENRDNSHP